MRHNNGSIRQSGLLYEPNDFRNESILVPILGIVLDVYKSDSPLNAANTYEDYRASLAQARVLVVNSGMDSAVIIPNVVITPDRPSGVDNFTEELPRGCSASIDGAALFSFDKTDVRKLDGDFCVVEFIGGDSRQPFISRWWPHPSNRWDPATSARKDQNGVPISLAQGSRSISRVNGVEVTITACGDVSVDTTEAGRKLKPGVFRANRGLDFEVPEEGGNFYLNPKGDAEVSLDWNAPTFPNLDNPEIPQPNPPLQDTPSARATVNTKVSFDKDFVRLVAGQVAQIVGQQINDGILLGAEPTDHALKGETFQQTFNNLVELLNRLIALFNTHGHSAQGAGAPFLTFQETAESSPDTDLSEVVKLQ